MGPIKMEELNLPAVNGDQIKISVEAADLNFADILQCQGRYQVKLTPIHARYDGCGRIIECHHSSLKLASACVVQHFLLLAASQKRHYWMSRSASSYPRGAEQDSCCPFVTQHRWFALKRRGSLKSGETILILAGAGGVGSAAIEIAKNLGSWIIAAASDSRKLQACKELGADEIINYEEEDLYDRVMSLTDDRGVDIVYDPVGGRFFDPARRTVAWEGRYLVIGFANGEIPKAPLNHALVKNYSIVGVHMGGYRYNKPQPIEDCFEELNWQATTGDINPLIDRTVTINALPSALEDLATENRSVVLCWI